MEDSSGVRNSDGSSDEPCESCGARLGGRAGCQRAFDKLSAMAWSTPLRGSVHNLVVDVYALQHAEAYCRSAKSYAAHLTGLCWAMDAGGDPTWYWAIPRWLDGSVALKRPADIADRGAMTIADVRAPEHEDAYPELVRQWARIVWTAYAAHHAVAREWLESARLHINRRGAGRS